MFPSSTPRRKKQEEKEKKKRKETQRTLRTHNQAPPLLGATIDGLNYINQLLLILQHPIQLIIIARAEITHHVFIAEEKHQRHRVVQLVHLLEVRHLVEVAHVHDREVFDSVCDSYGSTLEG
jgi:hypothetical protein